MQVKVSGAGVAIVNGLYRQRCASIVPAGFAATCDKMNWPSELTWQKLATPNVEWFESDNGSYIYLHKEGQWWIDAPDGGGIYITDDKSKEPPCGGWKPLVENALPLPTVSITDQSSD